VGHAGADHGGEREVGDGRGARDDRFRNLGDRVQVRGGHRERRSGGADPGQQARGGRAAVRHQRGERGQAPGGAHRPVRDDLSHNRLLQRARVGHHRSRREPAALLRRRIPGGEAPGRAPLLAGACDGRRVRGRGTIRRATGDRRRQPADPGRGHRADTCGGRSCGRGDAQRSRRDPSLPRRCRALRQQGRLALQGGGRVDQ